MYMYIHRQLFCPSQGLSLWLGLGSREQLMSPECSMNIHRNILRASQESLVWLRLASRE